MTPSDLCAYSWEWRRGDDRIPAAPRRTFVGHVCGRHTHHQGRHVCLADKCRSWHRNGDAK
jgi:hypothetical protein